MDTIATLFKHVKPPTVPSSVSDHSKLDRLALMEYALRKKLQNFLVKDVEVRYFSMKGAIAHVLV